MSDRVLVVDDNHQNSKLAKVLLEGEDFEVAVAFDAAEALTQVAAFAPHVILMDVQLPGMDGLALTRRLKADPCTKDIVIVVLTAYAMKGDREKAVAAGCDAYVSKPIDVVALPELIRALLGRSAPDQ